MQMQRETSVKVTGLCHSVQGTAKMLARWLGIDVNEINYTCAGINHLAWYTKFEHNGKDLYPKIKDVIETNSEVYNERAGKK